jgi:hypothetical protein
MGSSCTDNSKDLSKMNSTEVQYKNMLCGEIFTVEKILQIRKHNKIYFYFTGGFSNDKIMIYLGDSLVLSRNISTEPSSDMVEFDFYLPSNEKENRLSFVLDDKWVVAIPLKNDYLNLIVEKKSDCLFFTYTNRQLLFD